MQRLLIVLLLLLLLVAALCATAVALCATAVAVGATAASAATVYGGSTFTPVSIPNLIGASKSYQYSDAETGTARTHHTLMQYYVPPESDSQLRAVVEHGSGYDYGRLLMLLGKFWRGPRGELRRLLALEDSAAYAAIARHWRAPARASGAQALAYNTSKAGTIASALKKHLRPRETDDSCAILDIGCGTGFTAAALGRLLNASAVHGADFQSTNESGIKYRQLTDDSSKLPYDNESIDIVVATMVLHHVRDIETLAGDIARVLKPNGLLYVSDHDCWDAIDAMIVDIEHRLYEITSDTADAEGQSERAFKIYRYGNQYGWDEYFKRRLDPIDKGYIYTQIKKNLGPSRQFWAVFKKSAGSAHAHG